MKKWILITALLVVAATSQAITWDFTYIEPGYEDSYQVITLSNSVNEAVDTWNTYAAYDSIHFNVAFHSGIPTAQSDYNSEMGYGGMYNYRTVMHESSHYLGTGTLWEWYSMNHYRWGVWNGTYAYNLSCAYNGAGARQSGDSQHYWPYGANYDSEGVDAPHMVGMIGAYRHDMGLDDQTIGIASDTYRLCSRVSTLTLDSLGATDEGAQVSQNTTLTGEDGQLWNVSLIEGTIYFTVQNVANGLYLDSLGGDNGSAVGMTMLSGEPTDNQLWSIEPTDSFFFKIVNKGNGRGLDMYGDLTAEAGMKQYDAAGNSSWNMQWTFKHQYAQITPELGVVSQGRIVSASSYGGDLEPERGNNGCSEDRWTASDGAYPQWWHVDLGVMQPVTKVEVDWFPGGVFQYEIQVSDNASTWKTVKDRTDNTQPGTTVDYLTEVNARYVRIYVTGTTTGGWAAFMECRVYNESEYPQLLSMNRPCTSSSDQLGNLAVNANNVDPIFTRWCSSDSGYGAWWKVDLGSTQEVNRAVIQWFDDNARYYQYRIEGSLDDSSWVTLADRTGNTTAYTTSDNFSGDARYVRITVTGGNAGWPSFYDAQIYSTQSSADMPPSPPSGLAATPTSSSVELDWNDNGEPDLDSYTVYRSTTSGSGYSAIASNLTNSAYSDGSVTDETIYYYVVTATDTNAQESSYSAQVWGSLSPIVEFWDFEDGTNGVAFTDTDGGASGGSGGSTGVNGTLMRGWDNYWGPAWTSDTSPNGGSLAMDCDAEHQDGYLTEGLLHNWSSPEWTLELQVRFDDFDSGWCTMVGRDGSSFGVSESDFYFQRCGDDGTIRIQYPRADATSYSDINSLRSSTVISAGQWYGIAVVASSTNLSIWIDDGSGYSLDASVDVSGNVNNGIYASTLNWTFGRGWYGEQGDRTDAAYDNIRFSNRALAAEDLIPLDPPPAAPTGLFIVAGDGSVNLNWADNSESDLVGYTVYRSTTSGTNYTAIASDLPTSDYTDHSVTNGTTYHYVVTAKDDASNESETSSEASATPEDTTAPDAPTGLDATPGDGSVTLDWNANSEPDVEYYNIWRSTTSGGGYERIAYEVITNAYTDSSATNGFTYYYVVTATDGSNNTSDDSDEASATPSAAVSSSEYHIAEFVVEGGSSLSLTVSNSVPGHLYYVLFADTLTNPVWMTNTFEAGTGSNLMFDISIDPASTNRFFKLDVRRQ